MTATSEHPHAQALAEPVDARVSPYLRPRDAATLIVLDRSGAMPKVLMGKRHSGHKFMPGKFVFPGGGVEPGDRTMNVAGALHGIIETKLIARVTGGSIGRARALALAAIRETYEETGLAIGVNDMGAPDNAPQGVWAAFAAHGIFPSLEGLHFIARAITPPGRPKRFDARFFAVDASEIVHRVDGIITAESELVELVWQPLDQVQNLDLPRITSIVLKELEARIAAGFGHHLPVPFFFERNKRSFREEL